MSGLDWFVVSLYFAFMLAVGMYFMKRAGKSVDDFFVSGRNLPWWIIALSAVATYTDAGLAPAVTMLTFQGGLLGNAVWWIPYIVWMPLGAVLWSKYWRRLGTVTSAELIELRYGGKLARSYRGIYAVFMSFGFVTVLIGYVSGWLGAALGPVLGWTPGHLILIAGVIAVIYTVSSGLYGVAYTDAFQFSIFLAGNIALVPIIIHHMGGIAHTYTSIHILRGSSAASFFRVLPPVPDIGCLTVTALVIQGLFFAAAPTGGEGFTAQRFMAAKNEFHAQVGQLFNTLLTLVVRVVPFLCLGMLAAALYAPATVREPGELWADLVKHFAPTGLLGLLVAGVFAAYMATVSTQMNWGASYIINDLYRPFICPNKSQRHYVLVGRISSVLLFALGLVVAYSFVQGMRSWFLFVNSIVFAFILPLSWLRFFWWRLNIFGEASALLLGLPLSYLVWFHFGFSNEKIHPFWQGFLLLFCSGMLVVVTVSMLTRPESPEVLERFYSLCRPPGLWAPVAAKLPVAEARSIREETSTDLLDCCLGIAVAASTILMVISLLAKNWIVLGSSTILAISSGTWFMRRWASRGVFRGMAGSANAAAN
jgi:SSS family solute:Na+ symporter